MKFAARSIPFYALLLLIAETPAMLMIDGTVATGIIAVIAAVALGSIAWSLSASEAGFAVQVLRPAAWMMVPPALWLAIQVLPLRVVNAGNPIWRSAGIGLGGEISARISIDPGATLLSLACYIAMIGVIAASAIASFDRQKARILLIALALLASAVALILVVNEIAGDGFLAVATNARLLRDALSCCVLGLLLTGANAIRMLEQMQIRGGKQRRARLAQPLMIELVVTLGGAVLCAAALARLAPEHMTLAALVGLMSLAAIYVIRLLRLGPWGYAAAGLIVAVAVLTCVALMPAALLDTMARALIPDGPQSAHATALGQMLAEAPSTGTGAGTFAALVPIYRTFDEIVPVPTTATRLAIELGRPALCVFAVGVLLAAAALAVGAVKRGRDWCYPAVAASGLIVSIILAFTDAGILEPATSIINCIALGFGIGHRVSRSVRR